MDCDRARPPEGELTPFREAHAHSFCNIAVGITRAKNMACQPDGGLFPFAHFSDGALDLMLIEAKTWCRFISTSLRVTGDGFSQVGLDGVEYIKASEVVIQRHALSMKGSPQELAFNVDGELIRPNTDAVLLRVHPKAARVIAPVKVSTRNWYYGCARFLVATVISCVGFLANDSYTRPYSVEHIV